MDPRLYSEPPKPFSIPPPYNGGTEAGAATRRAILARQMLRDPFVDRLVRESRTDEDTLFAILADRERLLARVLQLEQIAPRRMKMPDGRVMVWHCPDDLIPLTDLSGISGACPPPGPKDTVTSTAKSPQP